MIGINPPWFQDPVETMAFNLYAMECEEKEEDETAEEVLEQCDDVFYENEEEINRLLEEYAVKMKL